MEHGEEADLGPQMFGIGRDRLQSLCRCLKENTVDDLLILVSNRGDFFRYGEDHVVIGDIQEFGLPILDPLCPRQALAFGTMSIPAAIEGVAFKAALVTALQMTAEDSGAAHLDSGHDAPLRNRHRRAMLLSIDFSVAAEHVRHFQLRTV